MQTKKSKTASSEEELAKLLSEVFSQGSSLLNKSSSKNDEFDEDKMIIYSNPEESKVFAEIPAPDWLVKMSYSLNLLAREAQKKIGTSTMFEIEGSMSLLDGARKMMWGRVHLDVPRRIAEFYSREDAHGFHLCADCTTCKSPSKTPTLRVPYREEKDRKKNVVKIDPEDGPGGLLSLLKGLL